MILMRAQKLAQPKKEKPPVGAGGFSANRGEGLGKADCHRKGGIVVSYRQKSLNRWGDNSV